MIVLEPDSPIESFQSPEAEHESAFVELQDMVKELFTTIEVTEVSIETVGTGGLVTSTLTLSVAVLPLPEQLILYVLVGLFLIQILDQELNKNQSRQIHL